MACGVTKSIELVPISRRFVVPIISGDVDLSESPEQWFHSRATHYVVSQVLFHLGQAGVFSLLDSSGPKSISEIAKTLNLVPHVLSCSLDYVVNIENILEYDSQDRVAITEFGAEVLQRFGRDDGNTRHFNFFDVRVGSFGPVWSGLGKLLSGEEKYGEGVNRVGQYAADGVYKVAARLISPIEEACSSLGIKSLLEVGVPTGLLAGLIQAHPDWNGVGLDKDQSALEEASKRAEATGVNSINWCQGDFFRPVDWGHLAAGEPQCALISIHFHELIAGGVEPLQRCLRELRETAPGAYVFAIEQERLTNDERAAVSDTIWLYSHSNVLIHHLVQNGRILSRKGWIATFEDAGCEFVSATSLGYLGYHLYISRL